MLKEEYDIRYGKALAKFNHDAYQDSIKMAFTFEEQCRCHNLQLLWMFAIEEYDTTPGAVNDTTEHQIHSLFCRMGADGLPAGPPEPPVIPTPIPTFTVEWAWMATDPYAPLLIADNITYNGTGVVVTGSPIFADYRPSPPNYYVVLRYPLSENAKTQWLNDDYNYGPLPDSNFRESFDAHGARYIVSRVALTLNNAELTKFY